MILSDVEVKICPRVNSAGHRFTEVLYTFRRDGVLTHACTRNWFVIDDSPHARGSERQQFIKRQREWGWEYDGGAL